MRSFRDGFTISRLGKVTTLSSPRKCNAQATTLSGRTTLFKQSFSSIAWKKRWTCIGLNTNDVVGNHSMSTQAGDDPSGHLNTGSGEGIFFLDSTWYISEVEA